MATNPQYANEPGYDQYGYPVRSVGNGLISHQWAGTGLGGAPDAANFSDFTVGADSGGVGTGLVYHVINGSWVPVGATIANLYGG